MSLIRRFRRCRSGATALEFAIVSLFLVLTAIAVIDFGRGFHLRNNMSHAMDIGARVLLIDPEASDSKLESAIRAAFVGPDPDLLEVAFASDSASGTSYRRVTIDYPLPLLIPGLESTPVTLTVSRRIPLG